MQNWFLDKAVDNCNTLRKYITEASTTGSFRRKLKKKKTWVGGEAGSNPASGAAAF